MTDYTVILEKPLQKVKAKLIGLPRGAAFTYTSLVLLGLVTGLFSLLLGASVYGLPMFRSYFDSLTLVALNVLPPVLLLLFLYFATGRASVSFTVTALFTLVISGVEFFKVQIRGDPFFPSDFSIISEAGIILRSYTLETNWKLYLAAAFLILGILASVFVIKRRPRKLLARILGVALTVAVGAALYCGAYTSKALYEKTAGSYKMEGATYNEAYIARGFLYPFIHSIVDAFPKAPEGYSSARAEKLMASYEYDAIPADKKVNVISVMLEAYCDFSAFSPLEFEEDVYGKWHELQAESVSGNLIDNIFAGGTIDTERLFLTGYTALESYRARTETYLGYFKAQGYYTEGFHMGNGWYYDRIDVHRYFGFDNYYFIADYPGITREDANFFPIITDLYEARDKSVPYFAHNLTFQNHGAYDAEATGETAYIKRGALSEESYNILNNYFTGIYDTTERIGQFAEYLRRDDAPVVLLLYGDHKPWMGNAESVYHELGLDVGADTEQGLYNMYSTPYIIWANDAAKRALGNDFTGDGGDFSPCFLMNKLFSLCSWGGDAYMKASNDLLAVTDVVHTPTGFFRENGALTLELSPAGAEAYKKFKIVEYYRRHK